MKPTLFQGEPIPEYVVSTIARQLASESSSEQTSAFKSLRAMDAERAASVLREVFRRRKRKVIIVRRFARALAAIGLIAGILDFIYGKPRPWHERILQLVTTVNFINVWCLSGFVEDQFFKSLVDALGEMDDPVAACILLDMALQGGLRKMATDSSAKALSKIKASDYSRVDVDQRVLLNRAVLCKNLELVRSSLRALEQIGDDSAFPALQELASGGSLASSFPVLAREARSCIEAIELAEQTRKHARVLLRPSQAPTTESCLLQPAGLANSNTADLLRPAESE